MASGSTAELALTPLVERELLADLLDELHALDARTTIELADEDTCAAVLSDRLRDLLREQD